MKALAFFLASSFPMASLPSTIGGFLALGVLLEARIGTGALVLVKGFNLFRLFLKSLLRLVS